MELAKLMEGVEIERMTGETRRGVEGIAYHSQQVRKGFLFAAIRGLKMDGHRFIEDALQRGAETILLEEKREIPAQRRFLSPIAERPWQGSLRTFTETLPPGLSSSELPGRMEKRRSPTFWNRSLRKRDIP